MIVDGGTLIATNYSELYFPGTLVLQNGASVTLTDTSIHALPEDIINEFLIGSGGTISLDAADDGPNMTISSSMLSMFDSSIQDIAEYPLLNIPANNIELTGTSSLLAVNSYIGVDFGPALTAAQTYTHNAINVRDASNAYLYGSSFEPYYGAMADRAPAISSLTLGADAYIYRWLNVTVGDEYGVPIAGGSVTARYTGITDLEGEEARYYSPSGMAYVPPAEILAYMGETAGTYKVTKADGVARIPYLTDIITVSGSAVSRFVGSYALTGSVMYDSILYYSTQAFSFPPYPAMTSDDCNFEFTVSIEGVSAPSPDQSRWLVVPPSLEIKDMTYYHAGDVIVAANGVLKFSNAIFQMVQSEPYENTIYVDNTSGLPTKLIFEDSELVASMPIEIVVKGMATLEVINSTLTNVMIVALEDSNIILENAVLNGAITTQWDSAAELTVTDSMLTDTPVLAGTSVGHFTDSVVPSIDVADDAVAHVYRWINVQVLDGAGMPLPNADISIRQYVSGIPGGSAVSSESLDYLGVARVRSEATEITALGSTYLTNYWVNATYTHGIPYYTDEVSVGVLPYSTPLTPNASYVVMQFDGVFPDLAFHASPPLQVEFDMASPSPGDEVLVTARVSNDGSGYAWDVTVAFYDDLDKSGTAQSSELIGLASIPMIRPGETVTTSVTWVATAPVDPNIHVILAVADPDDEIMESNEATAQGSGTITVRSLPDLYVQSGVNEVTTSVSPVVVNSTVQINALIHNGGSNTSYGVVVEFFDNDVYFATAVLDVSDNSANVATVSWTPTTVLDAGHVIKIAVDPYNAIEELVDVGADNYNNNLSLAIPVLDYPDLTISGPSITPAVSVPGGGTVVVTAMVSNLNAAPISLPVVRLYYNYSDQTYMQNLTLNIYGFTKDSGVAAATFNFVAPILNVTTPMSIVVIVNPTATNPIETRYTNNIVSGSVDVLDVRPDLEITSDDVYVQLGGTNRTSETFGKTVTVYANVWNMGGSNATNVRVQIGVRSVGFATVYNFTGIHIGNFYNVSYASPTNKVLVSTPWTINLTSAGTYEIWVHVDGLQSIDEPNEDNNWATKSFTILPLVVDVIISADDDEYKAGESIVIVGQVTYEGTSDAVKRLPGVAFELYDEDTGAAVEGSRTANQTTDDGGVVNVLLLIPSEISTGSYGIRAVILNSNYDSDPVKTVHISASVSGGILPLWMILLIVVAVGAVVAGFFAYTYVYGLGKLVECGECGAFIPAASKRCPKCGVEFESGTMKCSECGAWIPAASAECPNCGVKFVGEAAAEEDYMERMRAQYEDQVVSKYRELARPELGRKYNDKTFEAWWRRQPGYISFEDWLAKEEEKKKEGPVPCPVCGTLNPKEATVCHKCGTVFAATAAMPPRKGPPPAGQGPAAEEEQPVQEAGMQPQQGMPPAGGAPRMVIRRPIDRKVVPKKIIKTPLGEEKTEGGENQ